MKLYYAPGACSMAPHIVATEAGLKLDLEKVDLASHKTEKGADYYAVNPKGAVPALATDEGQVLTEGAVIMQYMLDKAPGSKLMPRDGMARWHFLELLNFVATELHKGIGAFWNPAMAPARDAMMKTLSGKLDFVEKLLGNNPYLTGNEFTAADAYAFTVINWTGMVNIDISKWQKIVAFQARVAARPAVKKAMAEEGLG
jgi:glutathione S-transferase